MTTSTADQSGSDGFQAARTGVSVMEMLNKAETALQDDASLATTVADAIDASAAAEATLKTALGVGSGSGVDLHTNEVSVMDYGAVGDCPRTNSTAGATDDYQAFQDAIDAVAALGGGVVHVPGGLAYLIGSSGSSQNGRPYGLEIKSGVKLKGGGSLNTMLRKPDNDDHELLVTLTANTYTDIQIEGLTLDGNEPNQSSSDADDYMMLWLKNVTRCTLRDLRVINPTSFSIRIGDCSYVRMEDIRVDNQGSNINSDCIHFYDTSHVVCNNLIVRSDGDDAFIIACEQSDISDYVVTGLIAETFGAPGSCRAVMLHGQDVTTEFTMENIVMRGVTIPQSSAGAVSIRDCSIRNCMFDFAIKDVYDGVFLFPGNSNFTGSIKDCVFNVVCYNSESTVLNAATTYGTIEDCQFNVQALNVDSTSSMVALYGSRLQAKLNINGNSAASYGAVIYCDESDLQINAVNCGQNILMQGSADNNTISLGMLSGAGTYDVNIQPGATGNRFIGGKIASGTNLDDADWFGTGGAHARGVETAETTDGSGKISINHGLVTTPKFLSVNAYQYDCQIEAVSATTFDVQINNAAGAAQTSITPTVYWEAAL